MITFLQVFRHTYILLTQIYLNCNIRYLVITNYIEKYIAILSILVNVLISVTYNNFF